jgi:hypothetical protein
MRSLCQRSSIIVHKTFLVVALTFLTCGTLFAQVTASGTISGAVKDKNQAVVGNATVTLPTRQPAAVGQPPQ